MSCLKLPALFASLFFLSCQAQRKDPCADPAFRDSLFQKFIVEKAYKVDYTFPAWQAYCDSVLNICPDMDQVWQLKGMPYIKKGMYHSAFSSIGKAAVLKPERWLPYQAFLKVVFAKDYEGGIRDFNASEKLLPGGIIMDHSYSFYRALCYLELGDFENAVRQIEEDMKGQAARFGPKKIHFNSLLYAGIIQLQLRKYNAATRYLEACKAAYDNHPEANYYLGLIYLAQRKKNKGRLLLQQAKKAMQIGYRMNEDNEAYVNYPFQICMDDIEQALK